MSPGARLLHSVKLPRCWSRTLKSATRSGFPPGTRRRMIAGGSAKGFRTTIVRLGRVVADEAVVQQRPLLRSEVVKHQLLVVAGEGGQVAAGRRPGGAPETF